MACSPHRGNVVVTGASTGIGAASTLRLDALGFRVFAGIRKDADGDALRARAKGSLTPVRLDVTDEASLAEAARQVEQAVGGSGLAGLVNNAGIAVPGPMEFLPIEDLRLQLEVNVIGLVAATQAFLPLIRGAGGRIVNIGSVSGLVTAPYTGAYCASKYAVEAVSDALRFELKPWGIQVAVIEPGPIATPIWEKSREIGRSLAKRVPQECGRYYGKHLAKMGDMVNGIESGAIPAERVADLVAHALTARRPKTRYLVGKGARLQTAILPKLPDRLRDWVFARMLSS